MKMWRLFFGLSGLLFMQVSAADIPVGKNAYDLGNYRESVLLFENAVYENPTCSECLYNLGNAYYKSGNLGKAVAAYRKALKINPFDEDVLFNLQFVVSRTVDKLNPPQPSFIVQMADKPAGLFSVSAWSMVTLVFSFFGCLCFGIFVFVLSVRHRKKVFYMALLFWIAALFSLAFTAHRYWYSRENMAVVISPSADLFSEPNTKGTRLIMLKEGATLRFYSKQADWTIVLLPDGTRAFVSEKDVEII
jgi:tetratricopeptide (TPR) repeat protein